jgi:pyruvate,water dikinase
MTIYPLTSPNAFSLQSVGGKALALQRMIHAGFRVPVGCVLSVDFFAPWAARMEASPAWQSWIDGSEATILAASRALQDQCDALQLDESQQQELAAAINALRAAGSGDLFAVRSSSPDEDLEQASFAGGYATTLGVRPEDLEAAIRRSFTSIFDARVFLYKKERGIATTHPHIAVIVQQQIDAAAAGVAFSRNPLNNCFDEVVINANHGLGESVVAGEADPDLLIVDTLNRSILETRIGGKQTVIQLNPAGGTRTLHREHQPKMAITTTQALALMDLVIRVEAHDQKPVDIEWAISDEKIYLLQVRPITTYLPLPAEMITAPGTPKRLYANATLIEQGLQGPLSVLGTDFVGYVLNKVGGPVAEGAIGIDGITFTATGGYYMNVSHAQMMGLRGASLAPGSFGDPRVLETIDSIDMQAYTRGPLPARLKAMRGQMIFKMLPMIQSVLVATLRPQHVLKAYQAALPNEIRRLQEFTGAGMTLQQQAIALTGLLQFFYGRFGIPMILAAQLAQRRIQQLFQEDGAAVKDHLANLGVALPGNKTAEMGEAMAALAAAPELARYQEPEAFLTNLVQGALSADLTQRWNRYMLEFGMRCPGEIDPATPRPKENPAQFFRQIKTMALASQERNHSARREEAYEALHAIALEKSPRRAKTFKKLYATWLLFGGYRETPKHYVVTVVDLFRRSALEIAARLVSAGRLDAPDQIFDLTIADIDAGLADPKLDLRARAVERTDLIHKIRRSKQTARLIDSRGKIFFPPRKPAADGERIGIPIAPGTVQGRVKVLHTADEKPLLQGEILVARATDPGWTPLFLNAKGIILEIGGALQHGAVVAREYGIPCVSGVDDATSLLQDGQLVEVNGSSGIIRILDGDIPTNPPLTEVELQRQHEMATRMEKERAKQKIRQTMARIIPLVLLPFVILILFVVVYLVIQLLMGLPFAQAVNRLEDVWQVYKPYLLASTVVVGVPVLSTILWKNRKQVKKRLRYSSIR